MKLTKEQYALDFRDPSDSCKKCSNPIWYPHTLIIADENSVKYVNSTFLTNKKVGNAEYQLNVCYECLAKEFPEIINKNSSKLFNTCSKYVKYAFCVNDEDFLLQKKKHAISLSALVKKYGEEEGMSRWKSYCELQRVTNSFEYKNKKLGWSGDDFSKFNKSRAVTKDNLVLKYGEEEGLTRWSKYVDRQKYTKSLEYFISKYGKEHGSELYAKVNKSKALTLDNYINKHGAALGLQLFEERVLNKDQIFSKTSQSFFDELNLAISKYGLSTYYHNKNGEFGKILKLINRYCKVDFFVKEINLAIEYYGDYWHANPQFYKEHDILYSNKKAKDIWQSDLDRTSALLEEHKIETLIVWQRDDIQDRPTKIKEITNEIERKIRKNSKD